MVTQSHSWIAAAFMSFDSFAFISEITHHCATAVAVFSTLPCVPSCGGGYGSSCSLFLFLGSPNKRIRTTSRVSPVLEQLLGVQMLNTGGVGWPITSTKVGMNGTVCIKSPGRKGRTRGLKGLFYLKGTGNRSLGLRVEPKRRLNPPFRGLEALLLAPLSRGVSISELYQSHRLVCRRLLQTSERFWSKSCFFPPFPDVKQVDSLRFPIFTHMSIDNSSDSGPFKWNIFM